MNLSGSGVIFFPFYTGTGNYAEQIRIWIVEHKINSGGPGMLRLTGMSAGIKASMICQFGC